MATVYSLICWGGRLGKSVTVNVSTDLVTLTRHGLRNGKGVQFASGTLPTVTGTALALNTTYYAKSISVSTFELYYDSGLTSKIDFTSTGTSLVLKGAFYQSLSDKSRWTDGGTENIFDGIASCNTSRAAAASNSVGEAWELGEDFEDDLNTGNITIAVACPDLRIYPINSAGHNGSPDTGYTVKSAWGSSANGVVNFNSPGGLSKFTIKNTSPGAGLSLNRPACFADQIDCIGTGATSGYGIRPYAALVSVTNCKARGFVQGIHLYGGFAGQVVANNTLTGNSIGINTANTTTVYVSLWNNVCYDNTTNWAVQPTGLEGAGGNAGASGDTNPPWVTGAYPQITNVSSASFANYAGGDLRPSASSVLIDVGVAYFGVKNYDISGDERPNYNNGGAEAFDIGAYEYDHGYGPRPASATISLTSIVSGSRVLITKASDGTVLYNDVPGTSMSFNTTHIGDFNVVVRKATASPFYREFNASGTTVADQTTSIKCLQQLDE